MRRDHDKVMILHRAERFAADEQSEKGALPGKRRDHDEVMILHRAERFAADEQSEKGALPKTKSKKETVQSGQSPDKHHYDGSDHTS